MRFVQSPRPSICTFKKKTGVGEAGSLSDWLVGVTPAGRSTSGVLNYSPIVPCPRRMLPAAGRTTTGTTATAAVAVPGPPRDCHARPDHPLPAFSQLKSKVGTQKLRFQCPRNVHESVVREEGESLPPSLHPPSSLTIAKDVS